MKIEKKILGILVLIFSSCLPLSADLKEQLELSIENKNEVSIKNDVIQVITGKNKTQPLVWRPITEKVKTTDNFMVNFDLELLKNPKYCLKVALTNDQWAQKDKDLVNWALLHSGEFRSLASRDGKKWSAQRQSDAKLQEKHKYHISIHQFCGLMNGIVFDLDNPGYIKEIPVINLGKGQGNLTFQFGKNTELKISNLSFQKADVVKTDYLKKVKAYADCMIKNGRDHYGKANSPLFAAALDRSDFNANAKFWGIHGIRGSDRVLTGANPMHDQNLYQILYALSDITGNKSYAQEADKALKYFFKNCQSPATGLMAWGEHLGWDFQKDNIISAKPPHEFFRPWILWDRTWKLAPDAAGKFAKGLWDHQIQNKKTGEFSRHANWQKHGPYGDNEYPRHGGFYIKTWSEAYKRTKDPVYLKAINSLIDMYNRISDPKTGCIPCSTNEKRKTVAWPTSSLSLRIDLHDSAKMLPKPLVKKLQERMNKSDKIYLKLNHDFSDRGIGFVAGCDTRTLKAFTSGNWTHTEPWALKYGKATDAQVANVCYLRYKQLPKGKIKDGYKTLILGCADRYISIPPQLSSSTYPRALASVIWHFLNAYEITQEKKYLVKANEFANFAIWAFIPKDSPLPKATIDSKHYEAVTGGDSLMLALLRLACYQHNQVTQKLVFTDR